MTQLWAIQTKLGKEDSTLHLVDAFHKLGLNWAAFPVIPFVHHVPDLQWDGPIVYYGSCGLVKKVWSDPDLSEHARLFFSPGTHAPAHYGRLLGSAWLNHEAEFITVADVLTKYPSDEQFFVRPDSGLKLFCGQVDSLSRIRDMLDRHRHNGPLSMDTTVVFGKPIKIDREYRTWIIDGEVSAVVGYKKGGHVEGWVPTDDERAEISRYAEEHGRKLAELEAFVLDVAILADGSPSVVEINDIHASGFYRPEVILDVVADLSNFVAKGGGSRG